MVLVNIRIRDPASCNDVWVKSPNYDAWKHAGSSGAKGGIGKEKKREALIESAGKRNTEADASGKKKERRQKSYE